MLISLQLISLLNYVDPPVRVLSVKLPNGQMVNINLHAVTTQPPTLTTSSNTDKITAYSRMVLELGLLFQNFVECVKVPNRERMLRTLKLMMILLKADNNLSKYADEILRFLLQQLFILSEHDAKLVFHSMFVNTRGRIDTHIPADLQMEFIVRTYKKYIKHMLSNKTESNIQRKTGALGGIYNVATHYDDITPVLNRTQKHSQPSDALDEISMLEDLRQVKPFLQQDNRVHSTFPNIEQSLLIGLNYDHLHKWLLHRTTIHGASLGN